MMHLSPGLIVGKGKTMALAGSLSGLLGFSITEALTSQWGLAALSTVIASVGGAILVAVPKIITARTEALSRKNADFETETTNLIDRMTRFHGNEIQFYQRRIAEKELIATLERKSKHKALSECQRLVFHINLLEMQVRQCGVEPPDFKVATYHEIVGAEDVQIEEIAASRVTEQPHAYGDIARPSRTT